MNSAKRIWWIIFTLAIIKFILPFILQSPVYELQRDEYLYYQQGQHLALGYLENPALLGWLASISSLLGGTEFWIKFWPALFGSLTLIVTCLLASEFGARAFGQFLAGLAIIAGALLRVNALFQPVMLEVFCWTTSIYFLARYIRSKDIRYFMLFGLSLALGFWSKYSVLFLAASLVLSLLLTSHRAIFARRKVYWISLVALLLILPNVWWQYMHRWPLVHHMQELQDTQLKYLSPVDFIKGQFLMFMPTLFVWIAGLVWCLRQRQWRFLFFTYFFLLALLMLGRGKAYYTLGIYPSLLAAGSMAWERITLRAQWLRYLLVAIVIFLFVAIIPLLLPVWKPEQLSQYYKKHHLEKLGLLKWEDQQDHLLPQDFADMLGWKELSQKAESFYLSLPDSTKQNTIVYCRSYGQAGALMYYAKDNSFRKKVFTDNGSFLFWIPDSKFKHLLFVGHKLPDKDDAAFQHFQSVRLIDSVSNIYSRQLGDKVIFYSNADSILIKLVQGILQQKRSVFTR